MISLGHSKLTPQLRRPKKIILKSFAASARKRQKLEACRTSSTCEKLLEMVGRGRISVCGAVDLANSMVDDGMVHEAIKNFASLGAENRCPANCERDLHRWLKDLFGFTLQPYTVWMNLAETQSLLKYTLEI